MKNKKSPVGQYILEGIGDTDDAYEYVEDLLPLIGQLVLFFNGLESDLDQILCADISDRSDQKGLLVLHSMMYATKVELFQRFSEDFMRGYNFDIPEYKELVSNLRECGTLRNRIVHANWEYTDNTGYTHVRFKMSKDGLEHELTQFSIESMKQVINKILETREALSEFEEKCEDMVIEWNNEIEKRIANKGKGTNNA